MRIQVCSNGVPGPRVLDLRFQREQNVLLLKNFLVRGHGTEFFDIKHGTSVYSREIDRLTQGPEIGFQNLT